MNETKRNWLYVSISAVLVSILLIHKNGFEDGIILAYIVFALLIASFTLVVVFARFFNIPTKLEQEKLFPKLRIHFLLWLLALVLILIRDGIAKALALGVLILFSFSGLLVLALKINKKKTI